MIYFTSDTHFDHKNIIGYSGRPFRFPGGLPDINGMNRKFAQNWNRVVKPEDVVYHLGDFSMHKEVAKIRRIRCRLKGKIILIRGNHDRSIEQMRAAGFDEVYDRLEIELMGLKIYLSHVPISIPDPHPRKYAACFTQPPPDFYHYWLCGHVHEQWKRKGNVINVGVDQWGYTPRTLAEIVEARDGT